jgi:glucose-6-phosphate 1-dehydrogenase
MEPPASFNAEAIRNEKVKLLQSIRLPTTDDIARIAVRGQYTRGGTSEELMPGYREEPGVNPLSRTETYAAIRLDVDNWRWAGVPFYVRTGKRLPKRVTEVALQFQRPPHLPIPASQAAELAPDALILRIQPDEGRTLRFGAKVPGHAFTAPARRTDRRPDAVHPVGRGRAVLAHRRPDPRLLELRLRPDPDIRGGVVGPRGRGPVDRTQRTQMA